MDVIHEDKHDNDDGGRLTNNQKEANASQGIIGSNSFLQQRGSVLGNMRLEDLNFAYLQRPQIVNAATNPLQQIINMSFDPLGHKLTELERYIMGMFTAFTMLQELKVPIPQFKCFINEIMSLFRMGIPYHNMY